MDFYISFQNTGAVAGILHSIKLLLFYNALPPKFCFEFHIIFFNMFTFLFLDLPCQAKRSSVKLDIYRKFSNALAVAVISSVVWIGYEVRLIIHLLYFILYKIT